MPRWDRDGGRLKRTVFDCAAFHHNVRATCRACGHAAVLNPHALWWRFARRGWDDDLGRGAVHFRCSACAGGTVALAATTDPVTAEDLPMPPEGEWKRAVNRFRN